MPIRPILKFPSQRQKGVLTERRPRQLHTNREFAREPAWNGKRWYPGEVTRLNRQCSAIQLDGSGKGICSCGTGD